MGELLLFLWVLTMLAALVMANAISRIPGKLDLIAKKLDQSSSQEHEVRYWRCQFDSLKRGLEEMKQKE